MDKKTLRWTAAAISAAVPVAYIPLIGLNNPERIFSFIVLVYFLAFIIGGLLRKRPQLPIPPGRVIAVVPAYNERPDLLHKAVESLLAGTISPDVIHVVDDGSADHLPPFRHSRVIWHRRENGGKHHAQATALRAELDNFDFVVTVDSDSVVDRYAVERCLRAFSDPQIMGVTGVVYAMNRAKNAITKVTDLHYVHSCAIIRDGLSAAGDIFTASGALAVWRRQVVMDNLTEYLDREVADDRHLTHFAQRLGKTDAIPDAFVYTNVPDNIPDLFRQRVRWGRDYYRCTTLDLRYLNGWSIWMRGFDFALMCLAPIFIIGGMMVFPFAQWRVPWLGVGLWAVFLYAQTFVYVLERRGVTTYERVKAWLLYTPVLYLFQLAIAGPAVLVALTNLRHKSWQTRDAKPETPKPAAQPTRKGRSLYFDFLRAIAILRVVANHVGAGPYVGIMFPSMGVMFALAGSLMARSLDKSNGRPEIVIWGRMRRLMPAVWTLAAILVPVMLIMGWDADDARPFNEAALIAWVLPLSDPPSNDFFAPMAGVLWYIRTYLWLVLLSPALLAAYRRKPLLTAIVPLAAIPLSELITFSAWLSDVLSYTGTYATCWIIGFAHHCGHLKKIKPQLILVGAAITMLAGLYCLQVFPTTEGPDRDMIQANPLAQGLWCAGYVLILFRWEFSFAWIAKIPGATWLLTKINSRAVTIYLWHQGCIMLADQLMAHYGAYQKLDRVEEFGLKYGLAWCFVIIICWTIGRVEDRTSPHKARINRPLSRRHREMRHVLEPPPETGQTLVIQIPKETLHR